MSWVFVGTDFFHRKVLRPSIRRWELLRPILGAKKNMYNTQGSTVYKLVSVLFSKCTTLTVRNADQWKPDYRVLANEKARNSERLGTDQ